MSSDREMMQKIRKSLIDDVGAGFPGGSDIARACPLHDFLVKGRAAAAPFLPRP
jgi:hypothetical protein